MTLACLPRSPEVYKKTLDDLKVTTDPRFQPEDIGGQRRTKCNWAVEAACEALGVHIPKGLLAREQIAWLAGPAARAQGWFECSKAIVDVHADMGHPTVVGWTNPDPKQPSHVAMLRSKGRIWQAGGKNYNDTPLVNGFGARPVRYFVHL